MCSSVKEMTLLMCEQITFFKTLKSSNFFGQETARKSLLKDEDELHNYLHGRYSLKSTLSIPKFTNLAQSSQDRL